MYRTTSLLTRGILKLSSKLWIGTRPVKIRLMSNALVNVCLSMREHLCGILTSCLTFKLEYIININFWPRYCLRLGVHIVRCEKMRRNCACRQAGCPMRRKRTRIKFRKDNRGADIRKSSAIPISAFLSKFHLS